MVSRFFVFNLLFIAFSCKFCDFTLNVDTARMTLVGNFTFFVHKGDTRDTLEIPDVSTVVAKLVMLDARPSFLLNMRAHFLPTVIDGQTDNSYVIPVRIFCMLF